MRMRPGRHACRGFSGTPKCHRPSVRMGQLRAEAETAGLRRPYQGSPLQKHRYHWALGGTGHRDRGRLRAIRELAFQESLRSGNARQAMPARQCPGRHPSCDTLSLLEFEHRALHTRPVPADPAVPTTPRLRLLAF